MDYISTSLPYEGATSSFIGGRKENQDTVGYSETSRGLLLVVCDGMGGGPAGKTASLIATKAILSYVKNGGPMPNLVEKMLGITPASAPEPLITSASVQDVAPTIIQEEKPTEETIDDKETETVRPKGKPGGNEEILLNAVKYANSCLCEAISFQPFLRGMGTTTTAVLINEEYAVLAHVGDSRIYQLRGGAVVFRTADHSFVGQLVRDGKLTEEQARLSAKSNIITRALGVEDDVDVDMDVRPYKKGDRFVLCTDGIWGAMPNDELVKEFSQKGDLGGVLDSLNSHVGTIGIGKGGHHDNFSAIIMVTKINSKVKEKMSTKVKITGIILAVVCAISIIVNIILVATRVPSDEKLLKQNIELKEKLKALESGNHTPELKFQTAGDSISPQ